MGRRYTRFLGRLERFARRSDPHLRATDGFSDLEQYEIEVLGAAFEQGTSITEQREILGADAPPHEFSPDDDLKCSVCRRDHQW